MSKKLASLLGAEEPLFSLSIEQLEYASGQQSVDVRLLADIVAKNHMKLRELGLDTHDTSGRELYHALIGLVKLHDSFLANKIGIKNHADVKESLQAIQTYASKLPVPQKTWAIKQSVIKRMLKQMPPKKVMKLLGYRSVDSLLKRESAVELLGGIRFVEAPEWQHKFMEQYKKLTPSDFEVRDISVVYFDPKKWKSAAENFAEQTRHPVSNLKEVGAVLLAPLPIAHLPGITIVTLPFVLHYMNELRTYAAYFKTQQIKADFGAIVAETLINDPEIHADMAGHGVHWRVLQRHYGRSTNNALFEPHVTADDLDWNAAEAVLYKIEPALHFWDGLDYVGRDDQGIITSFNILDVAISCVNNLAYGYQSTQFMRTSLRQELYSRYLSQISLEKSVLSQLAYGDEVIEFSIGDF